MRCAGVVSVAGASEAPKTLDLLRAAWQRLTSFFGAAGSGAASFPNKLIDVFPPGGATTLFSNEGNLFSPKYSHYNYVRAQYMGPKFMTGEYHQNFVWDLVMLFANAVFNVFTAGVF